MSIYYALVARGPIILVDFTEHRGNFQQITTNILQSVDVSHDSMCSYTSEKYVFHVVINSGLVFLCMTDDQLSKSRAYGYLSEIRKLFMKGSLKERAYNCNAYELNDNFEFVLRQQMKRFNNGNEDLEGDSKIRVLQKDVNDLKSIMTENIDKLLDRGDRLDILVDKTEGLSQSSERFATSSRKLKNKMWWQNKKMCLILFCVIFIIVGAIALVIMYELGVFNSSTTSSHTSTTTTISPPPKTTAQTTTTKILTTLKTTLSTAIITTLNTTVNTTVNGTLT